MGPSQEPVEVQLYVSSDRGGSWQLCGKAEPSQQRFMFRAAADGEYWFQVRTLDRGGRLRPEQAGIPELRVVVDTAPPEMQLEAQPGPAGQVTVRWQVREPNLKPDSLTIQYRVAPAGPWQPVPINGASARVAPDLGSGEVAWTPQVAGEQVQIRAEVSDQAGNPAVSHAMVRMGALAGPPAAQPAHDLATPWRPSAGPEPVAAQPPIAQQFVPATTNAAAPPASGDQPDGFGLPRGERPRMVNSRLFELQYDVESIGASGIARVELWGTRDGGRSWRSYAIDEDNRSPLLVTVDEEGFYGFRIVVTSRSGIGGRAPQSGDLPEIVVGVDLTRPVAEITAVGPGSGPDAGKLAIAWRADDKTLAPRPVSLLFSETPGGPWTAIATGLENTGRYAWAADSRLPARIYLRLEVRDAAGNIGEYETREAVVLNNANPAVQVRDVRPLGQAIRRPLDRY